MISVYLCLISAIIFTLFSRLTLGQQRHCTTPYLNDTGNCVRLEECPFILEISNLAKLRNVKAHRYLVKSICDYDIFTKDTFVCCPIEYFLTNSTDENFSTTSPKPTFTTEAILGIMTKNPFETTTVPFNNESENDDGDSGEEVESKEPYDEEFSLPSFPNCGITSPVSEKADTSAKIIGGRRAKQNEFPWIAALGYGNPDSYYPNFRCGGSLINSRFVLTAAHCVYGNLSKELYMVRLGVNYLFDYTGYEDVMVESIRMHTQYDKPSKHNDIAILKLKNKVKNIGANISPICLPELPRFRQGYTDYQSIVAGWGKIGKEAPSNYLLTVQVPVVTNSYCQRSYDTRPNSTRKIVIVKTQLCAGHPKKPRDACVGDSGGPLMISRTFPEIRGTRAIQIGVVSFGYVCGNRVPGVYTRVTEYIDWIKSQLY